MAKSDAILGNNTKYSLYSNQFIPLITKADLLDRVKLQGMFDNMMTGGSSLHINLDTTVDDSSLLVDFMKQVIKQGVIYCSLNYNIQLCEHGHVSVGKKDTCAICGGKIEDNFIRAVGFLTSTKNWNVVRREEDYPNRQFYKL